MHMAGDHRAGEPADNVPPVLDLAFDSGALSVLRDGIQVCAGQAGLPEDRVADVVLAVHELAANAVCHGGGKGRLRVRNLAGALHCQVDDGDLIASGHPAPQPDSLPELPELPDHGLWVARRVADQMQTLPGPSGTRVTITFALPLQSE